MQIHAAVGQSSGSGIAGSVVVNHPPITSYCGLRSGQSIDRHVPGAVKCVYMNSLRGESQWDGRTPASPNLHRDMSFIRQYPVNFLKMLDMPRYQTRSQVALQHSIEMVTVWYDTKK